MSRLRGIELLDADVAMLSAMPDFVLGNGGLLMKAKSPGQKVGVSQT